MASGITPPTPPPMRDPWNDPTKGSASGITPSWYKWLLQIFNTIIAQVNAITGLTIVNSDQAGLAVLGPTLSAGQLVYVTDYAHLLQWNGTAYVWGSGDNGSGFVQPFLVDPTGIGWHLCDGSNVDYLKEDGTLGNITLPDYGTASYLKLGTAISAGPSAPSGNTGATGAGTPTGAVTVGNNDANVEVMAGVGTFVAADPHSHAATFVGVALGAHSHTPGGIELQRTTLKGWFRQ